MWICKECGGKMRIAVTSAITEDFNINKEGTSTGKCLKRSESEQWGDNYFCNKCNKFHESGVDIREIAYWKD